MIAPLSEFHHTAVIYRHHYSPNSTFGKLFLPGSVDPFCYTLEDTVRPSGIKVARHTAIPATGLDHAYYLTTRDSAAFKRKQWVIYTEKDKVSIHHDGMKFKYSQFHGGNTHLNTEGCPLVAYNQDVSKNKIWGTAEKELYKELGNLKAINPALGLRIINLPQKQ